MNIKLLSSEFYFVRHGQTFNNAMGLVTGRLDIPLDAIGVRQAREMVKHIAPLPFVSCVCSPMDRAFTTAELLLAGRSDVIPVPLEGLIERGWGELEGVSKKRLDDYEFTSKGVELWQDFVKRTVGTLFMVELPAPVLIVAHSGTFRALCEVLSVEEKIQPVKNACPYKFYKKNELWCIEDCCGL